MSDGLTVFMVLMALLAVAAAVGAAFAVGVLLALDCAKKHGNRIDVTSLESTEKEYVRGFPNRWWLR